MQKILPRKIGSRLQSTATLLGSIAVLLGSEGFITSAQAAAFVSDFNTPGTFATEYQVNNGSNLQQVASGGLSASGGVNLISETGDSTAIFKNEVFDLSTGTPTLTISGYFLNQQGVAGGGAAGAFQLGFAAEQSTAFNGGSGFTFISARVRGEGSVEFQSGVSGSATNSATTANHLLVNGNWYFLTLTLTRLATLNTFSGQATLFNSDSTGAIGSQIDQAINPAILNTPIYTDATTYAGFRAAGATIGGSGVNFVDNFAATPEPGSAALLAIGALGLAGARRRRTA